MTEVLLMRHGECELNAQGIFNGQLNSDLTERGIGQAFALAVRLGGAALMPAPGATYASHLWRAYATGEVVTRHLGLPPPLMLPVLQERRLGVVTGKSIAEGSALVPDEHKIRTPHGVTYAHTKEHGFETFSEATARAAMFIRYVHSTHRGERVWVFTHGDMGIALTAAWTGRPMDDLIHELHFTNTDVVRLREEEDGAASYEKLALAA